METNTKAPDLQSYHQDKVSATESGCIYPVLDCLILGLWALLGLRSA